MFDLVDQKLREWVEKTVGEVVFSFEPPGRAPSDDSPPENGGSPKGGVSCYLLELVDAPPNRGTETPPLQVHLRYLMTTWAATPETAHALLGKLVFAAMNEPEFQVEIRTIDGQLWSALGAQPQPAFVLRVPARQERVRPPVQYVTEPVVIEIVPAINLRGVVMTSRKQPVPGAVVDMPAVQRTTSTDTRGEFLLSNIPGGQKTYHLRVRAKGRELRVSLSPPDTDAEPVQIQFDPIELD